MTQSRKAATPLPAGNAEWMTAEQAAQYLNVCPYTIRDWARRGKLTAYKLSNGWRFLQADLNAMFVRPSVALHREFLR